MRISDWSSDVCSSDLLSGSKPYSWSGPLTSHAIVHFWSDASKWVIVPAPDLPAIRLAHVVSTSAPSGVTKPKPVTTTRRIVIPFIGPCPRRVPRHYRRRASRGAARIKKASRRSEEHTSELQSLMRISYAVFCLKKKHTKTCLTKYK